MSVAAANQDMTKLNREALEFHQRHQGKLGTKALIELVDKHDLALAYTPGVAEPCRVIAANKMASFDLTMRGRTVAVISDGSAVLGLGNIGPEAAMPVMEGKALLMKHFAGIDAVPLVIATQDPSEIISFVKHVAPSFAGINLEDIAAPQCFQVEEALQDLGIAVFHDDQHGTAIVVRAALQNAAKVVGKAFHELRVVIVGSGAAGMAIGRMLMGIDCTSSGCSRVAGVERVADLIMVDSVGIIGKNRESLSIYKQVMAGFTNQQDISGGLSEAMESADVVIGVSRGGLIRPEMIRRMADNAIVMALANPEPEILPNDAKAAGAKVVATGRSDFANQINNVLAFPGVFKAVVDARLPRITTQMKLAAANALADLVTEPTAEYIIPDPFNTRVVKAVSEAVMAVKA